MILDPFVQAIHEDGDEDVFLAASDWYEDNEQEDVALSLRKYAKKRSEETIEGELMLSEKHVTLTYSTRPRLPMKESMKRPATAHAIRAVEILKYFLWPSSYDMVFDLIDLYPDCVIEFSTYSIEVGDVKGHNTLIWEVRNY